MNQKELEQENKQLRLINEINNEAFAKLTYANSLLLKLLDKYKEN